MENKMNLREKLHSVYEDIDHVEKGGRNTAQSYSYVKAADVLRVIRKSLQKNRIFAETNFELLGSYDITTRSGSVMHTATVKASIVFHDLDSDETKTASGLGDGADSGDKGIYKAQTGSVKNALRNAFLLPDEADPEADEEVDKATKFTTATSKREQLKQDASRPAGSKPPKAEIPTELPKLESCVQPGGLSIFSLPVKQDGDSTPDQNELQEYGERVKALGLALKTNGLTDKNLPASRKIIAYLLKQAGVAEPTSISNKQFDAFLEFASNANKQSLAAMVESNYK